jgi:hypothetical protein
MVDITLKSGLTKSLKFEAKNVFNEEMGAFRKS